MTELPAGFTCHVANIGVKDDSDDFVVITAGRPVPAAGVFTKSRFAGPSVTISRDHLGDLQAQAIPVGAVSGSDTRRVMPSAVSTGRPSRVQYSKPPIISLTG